MATPFPMLRFFVRHGRAFAVASGLVLGAFAAAIVQLVWPAWAALAIGVGVGAVVIFLLLVLVDLAAVVADMLLPQ